MLALVVLVLELARVEAWVPRELQVSWAQQELELQAQQAWELRAQLVLAQERELAQEQEPQAQLVQEAQALEARAQPLVLVLVLALELVRVQALELVRALVRALELVQVQELALEQVLVQARARGQVLARGQVAQVVSRPWALVQQELHPVREAFQALVASLVLVARRALMVGLHLRELLQWLGRNSYRIVRLRARCFHN